MVDIRWLMKMVKDEVNDYNEDNGMNICVTFPVGKGYSLWCDLTEDFEWEKRINMMLPDIFDLAGRTPKAFKALVAWSLSNFKQEMDEYIHMLEGWYEGEITMV